MEKFNTQNLDILRKEINEALSVVSANNDISLEIKNITFSDDKFTTKLEGIIGDGSEKAKKDFNRYIEMFGGKKDWFGKTFMIKNEKYTVDGIGVRSRKYPILYSDANGVKYKATVNFIKSKLNQ